MVAECVSDSLSIRIAENCAPMTFLTQTRVHTGNLPHERGNSFPTAIACLMGWQDPEAVFQVQEAFDQDQAEDLNNWAFQLSRWLEGHNLLWRQYDKHLLDDRPYMVVGISPRGLNHVCIYQNGKLLHDPHPEGGGLLTETHFETLEPAEPCLPKT